MTRRRFAAATDNPAAGPAGAPPAGSVSRRRVLATGVGAAAGVAFGGACTTNLQQRPRGQVEDGAGMTLRWLGNNGWELRGAGATVLIDPWLTRFRTGTYTRAGADPNTPISVDTDVVDTWVTDADQVLVTHGHYDHLPDIPHIATRTGATVLGTESHCRLLHALGAPPDQLSVVVGGERLSFGEHRIDVIASLHSASGPRRQVAFPGTVPGFRPRDPAPAAPRVISELVEGGTLAYQVTMGGTSVLNLGGSNYLERELDGRRPDVLLLPTGGADIVDYVPRLLELLGHPGVVIPTHWDDVDQPLDKPAVDAGGLRPLLDAVAAASPTTRVRTLDHGDTVRL